MPKSLFIDPAVVRAPGKLSFDDIPSAILTRRPSRTRWATSPSQQFLDIVPGYGPAIREFETMLNLIKTHGRVQWHRLQPSRPGPPFHGPGSFGGRPGLPRSTVDDYIFGSHRSHGEILAKGLSAIAQARRRRA